MNPPRRILLTGAVFTATMLIATVSTASLQNTSSNLIENPSAEVGTASTSALPSGWHTNSWGSNNSTFSYVQDSGATGNRSLKVETTSYSGGDAKWYFSPISIKPSTECAFTNSYKSNVSTNVTIQYTLADDTYSYIWLGSPTSSSTNYSTFTKSFTTPANAKSMTIFHLIDRVGWLNTDNYSLTCQGEEQNPRPQPHPDGGLIANPSVESGNSQPTHWSTNAWGDMNAKFSYLTSGGAHGSRSVQVDVASGTTGDAKWYFNEVAVQPGQTCTFSDSYKSNVATDVTAGYTLQNGAKQYAWLGGAAASAHNYQSFSKTFRTPADVKSMTVYHVISKTGWLNTDSFSLTCEPVKTEPTPPADSTKFSRPLISIEFDDGWKNAYELGFPIVEEFGFRATQYVITQTTQWGGYMNNDQIRALDSRGHDIGSHTVSHPHLPQLSDVQIKTELQSSKSYLQSVLGKPVDLFVTPYCESDNRVKEEAKKIYATLRNCQAAANTKKNFDAYNLNSYIVYDTTTDAEIQAWIDDAKANNSWMILVYHEVQQSPDNPWAISPSSLRSHLQIVKDSGVTVKKTSDALAEVKSQL